MAVLLLIAALDLTSVAEQNNVHCIILQKTQLSQRCFYKVVKWMCKAVKNAILKRHGNH